MPIKYPGRYQSRLLRYLNRQYIRWSDRRDRAIRHGQVATTWGAQVILYPFFMLFQSAQLAGRRLQQFLGISSSPSLPQLPPSDMAVRRVLEVAESFYLPAAQANKPALTENAKPISFKVKGSENPSPIAGIATQQEQRNLVLVNEENEILDILTPEQQQQLNEKIILEVESYLHQRHSIDQIESESSISLAPEEEPANTGAGGIFKNAIDWVKNGPVATVANLFGSENPQINQFENRRQQLKAKSEELKHRHEELSLKINLNSDESKPDAISRIDRAIANLETGNIAQSVVNSAQKFLHQVKTQLLSPQTAVSEDIEDPWLTTNDLFGKPQLANRNQIPGQKNPASAVALPPATLTDIPRGNSIQNLIKRHLQPKQALAVRPQQQSELAVHQKSPKEITKVPSSVSSLDKTSTSEKSVTSTRKVAANPGTEWIETEAQPIGYVKHPLERMLEWLDRAMLWLEDLLIKAWDWLQKQMKNKK
ncbi:MAG TPA: hypothetical protein DDW76_25335 [Cyanobacteria bacterium UBA11369]|nr:hypothetical protein [Cyanobacteria bacterium UBA11371]HBE30220.1 hypothetical protein [Cyanobacteria bacterium UBA11368]HBE52007.1 hypothetical protein [Cyanobacteria bacterium UBA11369]